LTEKGIEFETVNYVDKPLTIRELKDLLRQAGLTPRDAMRTGETAYKEHVAGKDLSDDQAIEVMAKHPELLQRPIVTRNGRAVLARPVENLSKLEIE